jgi:hypothetical protein
MLIGSVLTVLLAIGSRALMGQGAHFPVTGTVAGTIERTPLATPQTWSVRLTGTAQLAGIGSGTMGRPISPRTGSPSP